MFRPIGTRFALHGEHRQTDNEPVACPNTGTAARLDNYETTMLTHISIENFKGIRDRVEIELRPITLLFGPNSAGKSTILHALLYAQEVFERHNLNADTTAAGGPFINLGGFRQMVHGHDLDRPIQLGFRFLLDADEFMPYKHDVDAFQVVLGTNAERIIDKPSSAGVVVAIHWSRHCEPPRPVVKSCLLQLDNLDFARIVFDDNLHEKRLQLLALDHSLFQPLAGRVDGELDNDDPRLRSQPESQDHGLYDTATGDPIACAETGLLMPRSIFHCAFDQVAAHFPGATDKGLLLPCREQDDALPGPDASIGPIDTLYDRNARDFVGQRLTREWSWTGKLGPRGGLEQYARNVNAQICEQRMAFDIAALLDKTVTNILQALRRRLQGFTYLGPVREIPPRNATPPETPDPSRWATGLGAWDHLQTCDAKFLKEVSGWLSDPTRLNTGVRLRRRDLIALDFAQQVLADLPSGRLSTRSRNQAVKRLAAFPPECSVKKVFLVPNEAEIEVDLHDVGIGFSQLVPVVVTVLDCKGRLAGIEAPEYHLHPRLQAELGDLLIESAVGQRAILLVETHSEHLILRVLRRIRETTKGQRSGGLEISTESVGVYHVGRKDGQATVTQIDIDRNGEFVQPWPDDFFELDFYERFS